MIYTLESLVFGCKIPFENGDKWSCSELAPESLREPNGAIDFDMMKMIFQLILSIDNRNKSLFTILLIENVAKEYRFNQNKPSGA